MSNQPVPQSARWFLLGLSVYFCLQTVARVAVSPSAHLDESEQLVLTQALQWGYGPQPPLYTWVQWAVFVFTSPSVLGLSLLKNSLLFALCAFAFSIGRRATGAVAGGVLSALALAFFPDLVWEAQRDLTHSVLAALFGLAAVWALVRLCDRRGWREYLLFGAILGLGCLSKYNFAIAAVSLLAAALLLPEGRRALLDWRMIVALGMAAVIVAPHLIWAFGHPELALASAEKFKVADEAAGWGAAFQGLGKALKLTLGAVGPTLLVFGLALIGNRSKANASGQSFAPRLLLRMLLVAALLVIAGTVIFHATNFRGRWFLPLLVGVPVLMSTASWSRLTAQRVRVLLGVGLAVVAVVTVLLPARIIFAERLKRIEPLHQPYSRLAPQLQPHVGSNTVILAATKVIAGNLRLAGLHAVVVTPETWLVIPHPDTDVLLVWDATRRPEPDEKFASAIELLGLRADPAPQRVEAICFYHAATTMRLACVRASITSSQPGAKSN